MEDLSKLYKKLAFKVHPDHGGTKKDMQDLNRAYKIFQTLTQKYFAEEKTEEKQVQQSNFRFPYPPCTFRTEDIVAILENSELHTYKIEDIIKLQNNKWKITFANNSHKPVIRDNINASEDQNFYLYRARWD